MVNRNVTFKDINGDNLFPTSSLNQIINEETNETLETLIKQLFNMSDFTFERVSSIPLFQSLEQLDLVNGEETIEDIALNIPQHSFLKHVKRNTSGNHEIYPEEVGLLYVFKGDTNSHISFLFHSQDNRFYIGYYQGYFKEWSGWIQLTDHVINIKKNEYSKLEDITEKGVYRIPANVITDFHDHPFSVNNISLLEVKKLSGGYITQKITTVTKDYKTRNAYRTIEDNGVSNWSIPSISIEGSGDPENNVNGRFGDIYLNNNNNDIYIKTKGHYKHATGWRKIKFED